MSRLPVLLPLIALCACDEIGPRGGDDTASEDAWNPCTATTTVVSFDEVTALGFSAEELMAVVGGPRAEVFEWYSSGDTTDLTLELSYTGGEVRFVDQEPREGADTGAIYEAAAADLDTDEPRDTGPADTGPFDTGDGGVECPDSLSMDLTLVFATADGSFDESVDALLYADSLDGARASAEAAFDDLVGAYVPTDPTLVPEEWDTFGVTWDVEVFADATEGSLGVTGSRDISDDTSEAFMGIEAVWPPGHEAW
jgi:hypothetical protein